MKKPQMMLKWAGEAGKPISRSSAAHNIRKNRRADPALRIAVKRMHGETYIGSDILGLACCIYRAA